MEGRGDEPEAPLLLPAASINRSAGQCLEGFRKCLQKAATLHPRELSLVEDQLARFSIWGSSIGVFAHGRASMDHRLREAPDVHDAVTGLLEAMEDNIQECEFLGFH